MENSTYPRLTCGCVDIHTHVVPERFPKYTGRHADARWPSMMPAKPCHQHVMMGDKVFRTVSHKVWDLSARLEDMERTRVAHQVLSPMPELLSYWLSAEDGTAMCRYLNDTIASMVQQSPQHFSGLAAVPMQDVDLAIRELHYAVQELKLVGVEIGTNVNGVAIGDPQFLPFFQACVEVGAAVFVHPLRPSGMDRLIGPAIYQQAVAFPGEAGLSAVSMITGGTLAALPDLRIAFSHGGGSLQVLIPRLQQAWECMPAVREALSEAPRQAARRMFYDDLLYDAVAIEALVSLVGASQVMVGTDYPFSIMDQAPYERVAGLSVSASMKQALQFENARRWLGN